MKLRVNGEERELADGLTVRGLIAVLGLPLDGVAVAVNLEVVPRTQQATQVLVDGDRIEVVRAVGGG